MRDDTKNGCVADYVLEDAAVAKLMRHFSGVWLLTRFSRLGCTLALKKPVFNYPCVIM